MAAIRTFIAIALTDEVRRWIAQGIGDTRPCAQGVRWVSTENLHLTLRFLGDVDEGRMPEVHRAVVSAAREMRPFAIRPGAFGAFPNLSRPRVLWVGVDGDLESLRSLQSRIEGELVRRGFPKEDRPFSPHLTIGRGIRDRQVSVKVPPSADQTGPEMVVREVLVMKSDLRTTGSIYTILSKVDLKG